VIISCFDWYYNSLATRFLEILPTKANKWQSLDVSTKAEMAPRAIWHEVFQYRIPLSSTQLAQETKANLPWAEDHFQERIGGSPLNPPPSEAWWPYAQQGNELVKTQGEKFSHTYPERFWPKYVGSNSEPLKGIRFNYGDFRDVLNQLVKDPTTRQAFLPIFFPEDTGAVHGERVPCTLGYQFNLHQHKLLITYFIRSCDFVRHFRDDVYMAGRLAQEVSIHLGNNGVQVDDIILTMHIVNFHVFEGDLHLLSTLANQATYQETTRLLGIL